MYACSSRSGDGCSPCIELSMPALVCVWSAGCHSATWMECSASCWVVVSQRKMSHVISMQEGCGALQQVARLWPAFEGGPSFLRATVSAPDRARRARRRSRATGCARRSCCSRTTARAMQTACCAPCCARILATQARARSRPSLTHSRATAACRLLRAALACVEKRSS